MTLTPLQQERYTEYYFQVYRLSDMFIRKRLGYLDEDIRDWVVDKALNRYERTFLVKDIPNEEDYQQWISTWTYKAIRGMVLDYFRISKPQHVSLDKATLLAQEVVIPRKEVIMPIVERHINGQPIVPGTHAGPGRPKNQETISKRFKIFKLFAEGHECKQLSDMFNISINTVTGHLRYARAQIRQEITYEQTLL